MKTPSDAVIAVTHRCNAHCIMCNVWKSRQEDLLRPEHLRKLPADLRTINLSGGEPFLRNDLPDFVRAARQACPGARITLSTNAYLPRRIGAMMAEILRIDPSLRLAVSLDGVGEAHDRIRGDEGAFSHVVELLDDLMAEGYRGLRLSMTLTNHNVDQVLAVSQLAQRRGLELGVVAAHGAKTHLNVEAAPTDAMPAWLKDPFLQVIGSLLRSWRPRQWLRAHFAYNTYLHLAARPWRFRCRAGEDFFFLQADGTVYSCSVQGRPMGNILRQNWEEIWRGEAAEEARAFVAGCPESCWMICTARSAYRAHRWRAVGWIAAHKLAAHMGTLRLPEAAVATRQEAAGENPPH